MSKSSRSILAMTALLFGLCLSGTALANYPVPTANIGTGVIQSVNYLNHTVTVDGHEYKISPKAAFVNGGVQNIGGLQAGMRIQFIANGSLTRASSKVINIMVLPPAPR